MKNNLFVMLFIGISSIFYSEDIYKDIFLSINKSYYYTFPSDIITNSAKAKIPVNLTNEQKRFYNDYAGLYYQKEELSIDNQIYKIYQIKPVNGTWGTYYSFGKWSSEIDYKTERNTLCYSDGGLIDVIKDFSKSPFSDNFVKVAGLNYTNPFIYNLLKEKEKDSAHGKIKSSKIPEQDIRNFLIDFFSNIEKKQYSNLYKYVDNKKELVSFEYNDKKFSISNKYSLNEFFDFMRLTIEYDNFPFEVYVNTYFSDTYKRIYGKFGDVVLIEFRYKQGYNYLSFVLSQNENKIYIVGIRNNLDIE